MPTRVFIERPTLVTALLAFVVLAGVIAGSTLVIQQFPNVDIPTITVTVTYSGASAQIMSDSIVLPLEDQIAGAPSLTHLQSTIQEGRATISAQFDLSSNQTADLVEVVRRVQAAQSQLPPDLVAPTISMFDPSQTTIVTLALSSATLPSGQLSALATNTIAPAIQQVPGVGNIQLNGNVTSSIEVQVNPNALSAAGSTLNDVVSAISANNVLAPGGYVYGANRETGVNVRGDVYNAPTVAGLLLPTVAAGVLLPNSASTSLSALNPWSISPRLLRIGDVATVIDAFEPRRVYAYVRGRPAIVLQVQKATGASEVTAAENVIAAVPGLRARFPAIDFQVINNQSTVTKTQVDGVLRTLVEGIVLVAIVMVLFLRSWRNAAVVTIAMPASLLITLVVMRLVNFTLDTVSLMAMTLVIGILVDDSIVVLENSQRHYDMGEPPKDAALHGRLEIGFAALVLTLVDVVVFLPMAFLPGTVGRFQRELALVVVVATLTSLLVSFTVTPSLVANWSLRSAWRVPWLIELFSRGFEAVRRRYLDRWLPWAMTRPALVLSAAALSLAGALALVPLGVVGFEFIPAQDNGQLFIQVNYPEGTPLEQTRQTVLAIERAVDGVPDVQSETTFAGTLNSPIGGQLQDGALGQVAVYLKADRQHSTNYWVAHFRRTAQTIAPNAKILVIPATGTTGGTTQPIDYIITNAAGDPTASAQLLYTALRDTPGTLNVNSSSTNLSPQVNVAFGRQEARALNIGIGAAAIAVRAAFGGYQATQFETSAGLKYVQVIYPIAFQHNLGEVLQIPLRTNTGSIVHVGDFARLQFIQAPPLITRVNRQTVVHLSSNVVPGAALSNVQNAFMGRVAQLHLPPGVRVQANTSGNQQNASDAVRGIGASLLLSVILVFLLMVALFNSYSAPFIVMFTVPLAAIGALGGLALTHQTLNLFSLIGTVLLIGLVAKNGILLVDFANQAQARGRDRVAAIREAAAERFRPIIMTTFAMVFGMLPLALGLDPGGQQRSALGVVIIGGLLSSLGLSLLVVPIVYLALHPRAVAGASDSGPSGGAVRG